MIGMIAACTYNGIIGVNGKLPFNYPEDMSHFRKMTTDSVVIMGRNTYESIGKPLPKRRNILVTRQSERYTDLLETASSLQEAINMCQEETRNIWLIGGASIYEEGMQFAEKIVLTITPDIEKSISAVRFPWINPNIFRLVSINKLENSNTLSIATYQK